MARKTKLEADVENRNFVCFIPTFHKIYAICDAGMYLLWYADCIFWSCVCIYEGGENCSVGLDVCVSKSAYLDASIHDCVFDTACNIIHTAQNCSITETDIAA